MALGVRTKRKKPGGLGRALAPWAPLGLLLPMASCIPAAASPEIGLQVAAAPRSAETIARLDLFSGQPELTGETALAANAALPLAGELGPAASPYALNAATPVDQLRSLDCLAQAVYYEAASESEDGQRAVAQVVINRVRHPAWPNSVCGVVYQGPMRAGGGCQFTFTCDGSLARRPGGIAWARARAIAAEALAGRTFAGVGLSTFYHAGYVFPAWAPRLAKTAVIGAHIFYRLPGTLGAPAAFSDRYAGTEPVPRSAGYFPFRPAAAMETATFVPPVPVRAQVPSDIPQDARWAPSNLPESTIRDEYSQSGQWRDDAPAAVTGR